MPGAWWWCSLGDTRPSRPRPSRDAPCGHASCKGSCVGMHGDASGNPAGDRAAAALAASPRTGDERHGWRWPTLVQSSVERLHANSLCVFPTVLVKLGREKKYVACKIVRSANDQNAK
jgi:hypothetical protein